ncbi:hypothetical protein, partial [Streptomyces sp. NPDC053431]|uniref:hypothetical protein n=1 Tax=Streptomyces sp. NPDC053431 TaxID=3365703 RepID=UPI0037D6D0D1
MRSARIVLAATAAAGTLALAAPLSYASTAGDWDKDDSSHSQAHQPGKPHGGVHTGSGALALVSGEDWSKGDADKAKDKDWSKDDAEKGKDKEWSKEKDKDKPHGGMHTGSGALALVSGEDWSKGDADKAKDKDWSKDDAEKGKDKEWSK